MTWGVLSAPAPCYFRRLMATPTFTGAAPASARRFCVRTVTPGALSAADVRGWVALESRSVQPNAYLSPHFVLPALKHLPEHADTLITLVERPPAEPAGAGEWVAAGVFQPTRASRLLPVPHQVAFSGRYVNLGGILLDAQAAGPALAALADHLAADGGLEIAQCWADGGLSDLATGPALRGVRHHDAGTDSRAVLYPPLADGQLQAMRHSGRIHTLDRHLRRLRRLGDVGWRCHRGHHLAASVVEDFLRLEHAGWKGEQGSSLRSHAHDEAFFREMVAAFAAEGRAIFTELTVDGRAIASICHFVSGRMAFSFKLGWDPAFKSYSPGLLNEIELMRHAAEAFADIDCFDSGSGPSGFINALWPSRRALATVVLPHGSLGRAAARAASSAWQWRRRLQPAAAGVQPIADWPAAADEAVPGRPARDTAAVGAAFAVPLLSELAEYAAVALPLWG
jgi:CelD/BcsL family acetyltransferase involved in cellulose biosynthesis